MLLLLLSLLFRLSYRRYPRGNDGDGDEYDDGDGDEYDDGDGDEYDDGDCEIEDYENDDDDLDDADSEDEEDDDDDEFLPHFCSLFVFRS